jgi:hypothetical protein
MLIQNAIQLIHNGEIVVSSHVHDFQSRTLPDGYVVGIDGGLEYVRCMGSFVNRAESLSLYSSSPFDEIIDKIVWGTGGVDERNPLKYVFLKDCGTQYLRAMLTFTSPGPYHRAAASYILACRELNRSLTPDSSPE